MSGSYLEDLGLNTLSPVLAAGSSDDSDEFDLDLSLFTNSTFFDVDFSMGSTSAGGTGDANTTRMKSEERQGGAGGFKPSENPPPLPSFVAGDALQFNPSITNNLLVTTIPLPPPPSQVNSPAPHNSPTSGALKAKRQRVSSPKSSSSLAADEDKRRRNTAASARFRVKKKQREQQLHETAKEMADKAQRLEERVKQLEMENRWLKNLVVERKELEGSEEDGENIIDA